MKYLEEGFKNVYKEDIDSQKKYLSIIAEQIRNCPIETFTDYNGVFVPNDEYMTLYFGNSCKSREYTNDGRCSWCNSVIFPIYDILGTPVALLGYFPLNKLNTEIQLPTYKVTSSEYFDRRKYFFGPKGVMSKSLEDNYVILTDGVFDTLSLNQAGFNALALMGSYISKEQVAYLTLIDRVYLAVDNDRAGVQLLENLQKQIKSAKGIRFNIYKDVDDVLKSEHRDKFLNQLTSAMQDDLPGDIDIKL